MTVSHLENFATTEDVKKSVVNLFALWSFCASHTSTMQMHPQPKFVGNLQMSSLQICPHPGVNAPRKQRTSPEEKRAQRGKDTSLED